MRILLFLLLSVGTSLGATFATNSVNYQSVASTTVTGLTNTVSGVRIPQHTFLITHSDLGTTNTNDFRVAVQISLDNANWTTVTNFYATTTNAAVASFAPSFSSLGAYMRVQVVTSNTISASVMTLRETP